MKVFIWERNPLQQQNLQQIFEQEHHQVTLCNTYQELRSKLKHLLQTPLILVVNAHSLSNLKQLYTLHRYAPYLSILVICSHQDVQTHLNLLNAGADAFLAQPFSPEILLAQSSALQRQSARLLQARLEQENTLETYQGFTFDFSDYSLRKGKQSLPVNKREFLLLHYLFKHPQTVHSRERLYAIVWPGKHSAQGRQIDNLVVTLRKKLSGEKIQITSHYGEGYQLHLLS